MTSIASDNLVEVAWSFVRLMFLALDIGLAVILDLGSVVERFMTVMGDVAVFALRFLWFPESSSPDEPVLISP